MYLFIIGTRPEAIKICPIILSFIKNDIPHKVLLTGQHTNMVSEVLEVFGICANYNLNIMKSNQSLNYIISEVIKNLDSILINEKIEYVIVHGDTSTALAAALCAFQNKIKIIHIEAGLRTSDLKNPFPEEANRRIISVLSDISFCPTINNQNNLKKENNNSLSYVVGNTVIDAIEIIKKKYSLPNKIIPYKFILLTTHRRENIETMKNIFIAIDNISKKFGINVILPMHPNPKIKDIFESTIINNNYIKIITPQNYVNFSNLLIQCSVVITDSGGIQEEATYLNKPIIILRNETEREEISKNDNTILVGTNIEKIETAVSSFLAKDTCLEKGNRLNLIFGNGDAAEQIVKILKSL